MIAAAENYQASNTLSDSLSATTINPSSSPSSSTPASASGCPHFASSSTEIEVKKEVEVEVKDEEEPLTASVASTDCASTCPHMMTRTPVE